VKEEENPSRQGSRASSTAARRRKKKWDDGIGPGGPISQSAIFPQRRSQSENTSTTLRGDSSNQSPERQLESAAISPDDARGRSGRQASNAEKNDDSIAPAPAQPEAEVEVYAEGDHIIVENDEGEVLAVETSPEDHAKHAEELKSKLQSGSGWSGWSYDAIKRKIGDWREGELEKRKDKEKSSRKHEPARAYQFGNTVS
jgi:sodium/hydrogen antiporter